MTIHYSWLCISLYTKILRTTLEGILVEAWKTPDALNVTMTTESMLVLSSVNFVPHKATWVFVHSFITSAIMRAFLSHSASTQCTQTAKEEISFNGWGHARHCQFNCKAGKASCDRPGFEREIQAFCLLTHDSYSDLCALDWSHR